MGLYKKAVITDAGQKLLTRSIMEQNALTFVSVRTSDYEYPEGTDLAGLTELNNIRQTEKPTTAQANDTYIQVRVRFDNSEVSEAYRIQTIGVYAAIAEETPVLFSVIKADSPDKMPVCSETSPSAFIYDIQTKVERAAEVKLAISPTGTATVADIEELRESKADKDHIHLLDLDIVEAAFRSVFTHLGVTFASSMSAEEIREALQTGWNGESSSDPLALSAEEVTAALENGWNGETSTDPNALSKEEIREAISI